jgi:hypothetical protein
MYTMRHINLLEETSDRNREYRNILLERNEYIYCDKRCDKEHISNFLEQLIDGAYEFTYVYITNYGRIIYIRIEIKNCKKYCRCVLVRDFNFWIPDDYITILGLIFQDSRGLIFMKGFPGVAESMFKVLSYMSTRSESS